MHSCTNWQRPHSLDRQHILVTPWVAPPVSLNKEPVWTVNTHVYYYMYFNKQKQRKICKYWKSCHEGCGWGDSRYLAKMLRDMETWLLKILPPPLPVHQPDQFFWQKLWNVNLQPSCSMKGYEPCRIFLCLSFLEGGCKNCTTMYTVQYYYDLFVKICQRRYIIKCKIRWLGYLNPPFTWNMPKNCENYRK